MWTLALLVFTAASWIGTLANAATTNSTNVGIWKATESPYGLHWGALAISESGQFSVVSAYDNHMYLSTDYGVKWTALTNAPQDLIVQALACSGTCEQIWALTSCNECHDSLFYSADYGASWSNYSLGLPANQQWTAISASGTGQHVVAVGQDLEVYVSDDYGKVDSWTTVQSAPSHMMNFAVSVSSSGQEMVIGTVDNGGGVYNSVDFGVTWTVSDHLTEKDYFYAATLSRDGTTTYALDTTVPGAIFKKTPTESMAILPNAPQFQFSSIACDSTGQYVVVTYSGMNYEGYQFASADGGNSWNATLLDGPAPNTPTGNLQFMHIASSGSGSLVLGTDFEERVYAYYPGCQAGSGHVGFNKLGENPCAECEAGYYTAALYSQNSSDTSSEIKGYAATCSPCPMGEVTSGPGSVGAGSCTACPVPLSTTSEGCAECLAVFLDVPALEQMGLFLVLLLWLLVVLVRWSWDNHTPKSDAESTEADPNPSAVGNLNERIAVFLVLIFPLMDTCTNLAYLLSARFYSYALFALTLAAFLHPVPMFLRTVYRHGAYPYVVYCTWWLGWSSSAAEKENMDAARAAAALEEDDKEKGSGTGAGMDTRAAATTVCSTSSTPGATSVKTVTATPVAGTDQEAVAGDLVPYPTWSYAGHTWRLSLLFAFDVHDSLYALLWEGVTWVVAVLAQCATIVLMPAFVIAWLLLGCVAQTTKTICISPVWNGWFRVWTTTDGFDDIAAGGVDTKVLNTMLLAQLLLETLPSLVLQSVNNSMLGLWSSSPVAILSFTMSCVMLANVIYKYLYHSVIVPTPAGMGHIPIDRSIRVKIAPLKLDWGILDAKLPPYEMQLRYRARRGMGAGAANREDKKPPGGGMYDPLLTADEDDAVATAYPANQGTGTCTGTPTGDRNTDNDAEDGAIQGGDGSGGALNENEVI